MLLNEEFHDLYIFSHITRAIKSRRMSGARHVTCMGRLQLHATFEM
jgi:hypothetical protein